MRTTVDIPDEIYQQLKSKAALEGTSVRMLITEAAKSLLKGSKLPPIRPFQVPVIPSKRPGSLNLTNEEIDDILFSS